MRGAEGSERVRLWTYGGSKFRAERMISTKALRRKCAWFVQENQQGDTGLTPSVLVEISRRGSQAGRRRWVM